MRLTTFSLSLPHIMCFYIIVSHVSKHLDFLLTTTSWCLIPFFHSPSVSNLSFLLSLLHLYTLTFQINIVVFSFPFSLSPGKIFKDLFCFVFCFEQLNSSEVTKELVFLVPGHRGRSLVALLRLDLLPGFGCRGAQVQAARPQRVQILYHRYLLHTGGAVTLTLLWIQHLRKKKQRRICLQSHRPQDTPTFCFWHTHWGNT